MRKIKNDNEEGKNTKKKVLLIIILLIIILILFVGIILYFINNKEKDLNNEIDNKHTKVELVDNLDVEVNSEVNLLSFIKNNNNLEIINGDENVDTSKLGSKELVVKYKDNGEENEYKFTINVKDTTSPKIEFSKEISTTVGSEPLTIDRNLSIAATVRALEIAYGNKFSHTRPDGSDCYTVFDDLGIRASIKGENLTAGEATVKSAAENWKNSSTHYSNMINTSFTKIGIGMFTEKASEYYYYWVQLFSN